MNTSYISPFTIILYVSVLVVSSFFAFLSEKKVRMTNDSVNLVLRRNRKIYFFFSFIPLYILLILSACGADHFSYNNLFELADNFSVIFGYGGMELGFTLFLYIVRLFTKNVDIFNAILAFVFLGLIYFTIYRLRTRLHVGWAVFCFVSIFFFQYMSLKRIYLAGAMVFFSTPYWLKSQYGKVIICLIIAVSFHISSIIAFIPFLFDRFLKIKIDTKKVVFLFVVILIFLIQSRGFIASINFGERHADYGLNSTSSIGFLQLFYYLPLLFIYDKAIKQDSSNRLYRISFLSLLCAFGLGIFSYYFDMIGRAFVIYMLPIVFFPTIFLYSFSNRVLLSRNGYILRVLFIVLYCSVRLYFYFSSYLVLDQISPYTTIFGDVF